ncbi:MAG: D-alanyl-D-alanine carboxypeptidase [Sulfobacillus acidophilus]|uniref:D-alanyl-D-alanine carboxypeptidase n=1 Tax=Sulfobacillus acidophilus TaxID=53633 RepID=A0A2T2WN62_9FIRM|nr:MAG: D-alanyl-D-alanine carboxypeptidase [Sulfobacillus acidophilus]
MLHRSSKPSIALSPHRKVIAIKTKLSAPATVTLPRKSAAAMLPFSIGENSGVLWNLSTGQLLWAYHPYLREPYASTTKLMTIYLIIHRLPLSQVVSISPLAAGTTGSDIRMEVGEHFTVRQLLYALMLASANDAAVALAQQEAGTVPAFLAQMRKETTDLGMTGTTYADPDGLSPGSAGSAWDLSIIARADMESPLFRRIVKTKEISLPNNPVVRNLNTLLFLDPSVIGIKTGWTTAAGFNLVFAATRPVDGHKVTLLGVIMHGQDGFPPEDEDAEKILNWGFHQVKITGATTPP